jgi:hypothetical protein
MRTITRGERIYFGAVGLLALWVGIWGYFIPDMVDKAIPWLVQVFNLVVAGTLITLAPKITPGFWSGLIASLISTNLFFGFGGFLPLPSVDGEVIWRELLRPISSRLHSRNSSVEMEENASPSQRHEEASK